jgi:excisionase family DNA binding protein
MGEMRRCNPSTADVGCRHPCRKEDELTAAPHIGERLLTPGEVAALFRVDPKTVTRWATAGRIGSIRTPGGHRRFRESEVKALLAELTTEATASAMRSPVE